MRTAGQTARGSGRRHGPSHRGRGQSLIANLLQVIQGRVNDMTATTNTANIDSVLQEDRIFECSAEFRAQARVQGMDAYERLYREAESDPAKFWAEIASELHWFKPWDKVLDWNCPWAKWFAGGEINLSYNCLDRHVATWRRNKAAIIWEGEPGETQTLT